MIRVTQSRVGERGTCFRACLATILNLPERAVVDFDGPRKYSHDEQGLDDYWANVEGWLAERGLRYRRVPVDGAKPVGWSTVEGVSPRGGLHACVAYDGELVHDPHPQDGTGRGLVEPRYYGLLEPVKGRARDAGTGVAERIYNKINRIPFAEVVNARLNSDQGWTVNELALSLKEHHMAGSDIRLEDVVADIQRVWKRKATDRADMAALRRNTERQGGPFFMQETTKGGAERTLPVSELSKAADGRSWHGYFGSKADPRFVREGKKLKPVPGTKIKHEEGWKSAACTKANCVVCSSLPCACPCHKRGAKDASPARIALLLAALLAWYRARKAECGEKEYDLTRYVPKRRTFDALPLNRYPMSRLLDALGIDIKEYMRRGEAQKERLLRLAIEKLDAARADARRRTP